MAIREILVDRRAAMQRAGMDQHHIAGFGGPGQDVVGVGVQLAFRLDIGQPGQGSAAMEGLGRVVRIEKGGPVITRAVVRATNDLQRVLLGHGFETDPGVTPVLTGPGQIGGVLVPECASPASACLEKHFLGEIPDISRAPEVGKQPTEGQGRHQLFQVFLGMRVGIVDMRLLDGAIEHAGGMRAMVLHRPVVGRSAPGQLLFVQKTFDQDCSIFLERFAQRVVHGAFSRDYSPM
ncbi:hypothetical protein D3C85_1262880 [compost metagenome]